MDGSKTATGRTATQTVRIAGVRTKLTTRAGKVTAAPALPLEWELQAAMVRALRSMPEYSHQFLLAADMNAERRGPKARMVATASGMTPGEPDLRIYGKGGRLLLIENKVGRAPLTDSQKQRHPALALLDHPVAVLRAVTCEDAAMQAVTLVRGWLTANANGDADSANDASAAAQSPAGWLREANG